MLGDGIPVLDDAEYYIGLHCEKLPKLIVDRAESVMHKLYNLKYVTLRKYCVEEFNKRHNF